MTTKNTNKASSVTRLWADTNARLCNQASKAGVKLTEWVDELSLRAAGFEVPGKAPLPPRRAIHEPSRQAGRAEGYAEALADLADQYHQPQIAYKLARDSGVDFSLACEFDNRILRECGYDAKRGTLLQDHKRSPKP